MIPYKEVKLAELVLDQSKPVFFDTETIGLYGKIRLAQFYQHGDSHVQLVNYPDDYILAQIINKYHCVMHNSSYDLSAVQAAIGKFIPEKFDDTLYLARLHWYKKDSFALDAVLTYILNRDPYKEHGLDKKALQKTNWNVPVLTDKQLVYAAMDVYYMPLIWDECQDVIESTSYRLDILALRYALDFQTNGYPVLKDRLQAKYRENLVKIAEYDLPINVNSYQQVRPYIGSDQSDGLGLAYLALEGNTRAKEVSIVRKIIKENSFLSKFDTPDGRIYGKFLPSARSGRFTCKDQNLQQTPRSTKGCFGYDPDQGEVIVYSDFSQLELRAICAITGEPRMEKLFREGIDVHGYTAEMLFGKDYTPTQRQIAKTCNFNLLYGGGWKTLGNILVKDAGILLTEHELKKIKNKWLNLWRVIAQWQQSGISAWRNSQPWSTPFGRRYVAKMMTDQLNIQVQGFGAEVAKLAMHYMMPRLPEYDAKMLNFVHDDYKIGCAAEEETYKAVSKVVAESMKEAWEEASKCVKIKDLPMPVEVRVGYNIGDMEEGDFLYELEI